MPGPFDHPDLSRYINRFYGRYRGIVLNTDDPLKAGRITVTVPSIHIKDPITGEVPETGWCWPIKPGPIMRIPPRNSFVWVEFEAGDVDRPLWEEAPFTFKGGIAQNDKHSRGEYDLADNMGGRADGSMPESHFGGSYRNVETWQLGNNLIELDNTEGENRIQIQHSSGTRIEILKDGTINAYTAGNIREVVRGKETKVNDGAVVVDYNNGLTETHKKTAVETFNKNKETFVLGDNIYEVATHQVSAKKIIYKATGKCEMVVGGDYSKAILGNDSSIIAGTLNWIVSNALGLLNPLSETVGLHAVNGQVVLKAGPSILLPGFDHTQLSMGINGLFMKAMVRAVLNAPITQIGVSELTAINPVAKATPLISWLVTHVHPVPGGPPEAVAAAAMAAAVPSPTLMCD